MRQCGGGRQYVSHAAVGMCVDENDEEAKELEVFNLFHDIECLLIPFSS